MIKNFNLLVFPHVDMLMKEIKKPKVADEDLVPIEGTCWYLGPFHMVKLICLDIHKHLYMLFLASLKI